MQSPPREPPGHQPPIAPWAYDPGPAPRERPTARVWGLIAGGLAIFAVGMTVGMALDIFNVFNMDPPPVVTHGHGGEVRHLSVLAEGICLAGSVSGDLMQFEIGATRPCSRPHQFEAYGEATAPEPSGSKHDAEALAWLGNDTCHFLFEPYVNAAYDESSLAYAAVVPSPSEWERGGRDIRCLVFDFEGRTLDRAVAGSGI